MDVTTAASTARRVVRSRVAVCGDTSVGKTALVQMFVSKGSNFPSEYKMTSGADVQVGQAPGAAPDVDVQLYLFDTSGHPLYQETVPQYLAGVQQALLVYDVSRPESLDHCRRWLETVKQCRADPSRPLQAALVATKLDLSSQRHVVDQQAAKNWAKSCGMEFFEVSAMPPGTNFEAPFAWLAGQVRV